MATKVSILNNVTDNLWTLIKSQNPNLIWSIEKDNVEARQWYFDKADGSINHGNRTYFWYGENDFQEIMKFIDSSCDTKSPKYFNTGGPRKRSFSNLSIPSRSYSTSSSRRKRVGLIGARGYTGNELITLLDAHPNIEISHVSSRELAGKTIPLENQPSLTYSNLSADMAASCSDVDAWIMALPNKVCEPWVRSITSSSSGSNSPVIVDLSADYRFDSNWTYGLPELYPGRRSLLRQSKRISNPGCYATYIS